jgi:hypothetical protein
MPRYADYTEFAASFLDSLPSLQELESQTNEFWDLLEVNAERVLEEANDPEFLEEAFSNLGIAGLQVLCCWASLEPLQARIDLKSTIAGYLADNLTRSGCQSIILINEFLYRRRANAIEAISRLLLPAEQFEIIYSSDAATNSKRFCYALAAFALNPHNLRLLMLYESAERAGYTRYVLVPRSETPTGNSIAGELVSQAQKHIEAGVDLAQIDVGIVNDLLDDFERRYGHQKSQCFEVFKDDQGGTALIFVLRYLRESYIREVDSVLFGEEAELIVLRLCDEMRTIDEHSSTGIGVRIATAIASGMLGDANIRYIEDTKLTKREDLEDLLDVLRASSDVRLWLRELYVETAPIDQAPILILRCDKNLSLSSPLEFLEHRDIDLLQDLHNIRSLKVAFAVPSAKDEDKDDFYSFTIYCDGPHSGDYFLPYVAANRPTDIRSQFEFYLSEKYNVRIVPGTR